MSGTVNMSKRALLLLFTTCIVGFSQQDLAGTWQLTTISASRGTNFSATLVIKQVGIDLSGQITWGTSCATSATDSFTGSVLPSVSLRVDASNERATFSNGTVAQGQVSGVAYSQIVGGTYTAKFINARCNGFLGNGDNGTWTAKQLTKPPPPNPPPAGPGLRISGVINAASGDFEASALGEIVSIFADSSSDPIGPTLGVGLQLDANGRVATSLAGVQVGFVPLGVNT